MEKKYLKSKNEITFNQENTNYSKHKNSSCEENKWQQFANDLGATDKDDFLSSYGELVDEIIEEIHDDTDSLSESSYKDLNSDFDYNNSPTLEEPTSKKQHRKTFQHKRKHMKNQNSIKSIGAKLPNKTEKLIRKKTSIALFCESMATTISNSNLPIEKIFLIQRDVLNIVTNHIGKYKQNEKLNC